jgi:hypothetical protein
LDEATGDALRLVEVKLVVGKTVLSAAYTDYNGEYTFANVPARAFTLEFRKRGFEFFPTILEGKVPKTDADIWDIKMPVTSLIEKNATSDIYYSSLAQKTVERVQKRLPKGGPEAQTEYARAWSKLEKMKIAPSGRVIYARSLTKAVPEIVRFKLPKLQDYAVANPDAVRRFQAETERAVSGEAQLTDKADLKREGINEVLIVDVAAHALDESTAPVAAKQEFATKVGQSYGAASEAALYKTVPGVREGLRRQEGTDMRDRTTGHEPIPPKEGGIDMKDRIDGGRGIAPPTGTRER